MAAKHLHHKKLFDQAARSKTSSSLGRNIDDKGTAKKPAASISRISIACHIVTFV